MRHTLGSHPGAVAQLVRAPGRHPGGREFKSRRSRQTQVRLDRVHVDRVHVDCVRLERAVQARLAQRQSTRVTGGRSDGQHVQRVPSAHSPKDRTPDYGSGSGGSSPPGRTCRPASARNASENWARCKPSTLPWSRGEDASFRSWWRRFESSWEHLT